MLLGELLVSRGLATPDQIRIALSRQERKGGRIGDNLIELGIITRVILEAALREQYARAMQILAREDLLARAERRFGRDHPQAYHQRCRLAAALVAGGKAEDALNHAERGFAGLTATLGAEHAWTAECAETLAAASGAAALPGEGPAVAAGVGAGEQHAVAGAADDLDAARAV
jgi:hypothetical protein